MNMEGHGRWSNKAIEPVLSTKCAPGSGLLPAPQTRGKRGISPSGYHRVGNHSWLLNLHSCWLIPMFFLLISVNIIRSHSDFAFSNNWYGQKGWPVIAWGIAGDESSRLCTPQKWTVWWGALRMGNTTLHTNLVQFLDNSGAHTILEDPTQI